MHLAKVAQVFLKVSILRFNLQYFIIMVGYSSGTLLIEFYIVYSMLSNSNMPVIKHMASTAGVML